MKLDITTVDFNLTTDKNYDQSFLTRYVLATDLIKQYKKYKGESNQLKVLDLGGYNGISRDLLPNDNVTILDVFEDEELENYIKVNEVGVPCEDDYFDVLICTDVLEHIPSDEREKFINEALRVTKNLLVIAAPFEYGPLAKEELIANELYRGQTGKDYIWLKEHRDYQLPEKVWMESLLSAKVDIRFNSFAHADLRVWSELLSVGYFISNNIAPVDKKSADKLKLLNREYKKRIAKVDFPKEGYRTYYVISKGSDDIELITPTYDSARTERFLAQIRRSLGSSIAKTTSQLHVAKTQVSEQEKVINELRRQMQYQDDILNSKRYKMVNRVVNTLYGAKNSKKRSK